MLRVSTPIMGFEEKDVSVIASNEAGAVSNYLTLVYVKGVQGLMLDSDYLY